MSDPVGSISSDTFLIATWGVEGERRGRRREGEEEVGREGVDDRGRGRRERGRREGGRGRRREMACRGVAGALVKRD